MARQVWLITGASSGFGALLAEKALQAGHDVIATARNPSKAAQDYPQITSMGGKWLQLDVSSKGAQEHVKQAIESNGGKIDVVINNAGYGLLGSIEDIRYGLISHHVRVIGRAKWLSVRMNSISNSRLMSTAW